MEERRQKLKNLYKSYTCIDGLSTSEDGVLTRTDGRDWHGSCSDAVHLLLRTRGAPAFSFVCS